MDNRKAFIIGNGFDLNLGLKTSYINFISNEIFKRHLNTNNYIIDYLYSQNKQNTNWIDIEIELKEIYNKIMKTSLLPGNSKVRMIEFKLLCSLLSEYIKGVNNTIAQDIDINSYYFDLFKNQFAEFDHGFVACFNYTNTLKHLHIAPTAEIEYIHGEAERNNIVLGVEDTFELKKEYDFLYKTSHPYFNINNLIKAFRHIREFVFMGHSLGETDHYLFKSVFKSSCMKTDKNYNYKFTFYCYGEDDIRRMKSEIRQMIGSNGNMIDFYGFNTVLFYDIKSKE